MTILFAKLALWLDYKKCYPASHTKNIKFEPDHFVVEKILGKMISVLTKILIGYFLLLLMPLSDDAFVNKLHFSAETTIVIIGLLIQTLHVLAAQKLKESQCFWMQSMHKTLNLSEPPEDPVKKDLVVYLNALSKIAETMLNDEKAISRVIH